MTQTLSNDIFYPTSLALGPLAIAKVSGQTSLPFLGEDPVPSEKVLWRVLPNSSFVSLLWSSGVVPWGRSLSPPKRLPNSFLDGLLRCSPNICLPVSYSSQCRLNCPHPYTTTQKKINRVVAVGVFFGLI